MRKRPTSMSLARRRVLLALLAFSVAGPACGSRQGQPELEAALGRPSMPSGPAGPGATAALPGTAGSIDPAAAGPAAAGPPVSGDSGVPSPKHVSASVGPSDRAITGAGQPTPGRGVAGAAGGIQAGAASEAKPVAGGPTPGGAAAIAGQNSAEAGKPEIVLGSLGTASGVIGAATEPIVAATKAWGADVNARGGLAGHPVRIVFGDDGGDPAKALALARRMVEQDKVVAFVGTYLVTTTSAVTPYLEQVQVPMIGGPGGNEIEDRSPMVFNPQMGADEALGHNLLNTVVTQSDKRKAAVLYCREASSCASQAQRVKQFASLYGMTVVSEAQVSIAQPDYTAEVLAARNAGADVVITTVDERSIVRIARSAHRQGYSPVVAGSYTVNNDTMLDAPDDAEGVLGISATASYCCSPLLADYRKAVGRYVPGARLAGYGATAWVQGKLVERLAAVFGPKPKPTSADILEALYSLRDETLGGLLPPITFNRGPHGRVNRCFVPIKIAGGKITAPLGDRFVCARG